MNIKNTMGFEVVSYEDNKAEVKTDFSTFVVWHDTDVTREPIERDCFNPNTGHYTQKTGQYSHDATTIVKGVDIMIAEDVRVLNVTLCKEALKQIAYVISEAAIDAAKELEND